MTQFRAALLAVIPALENVKIPWREEEAYDEWDRVASALFHSIVLDPIASSDAPGAVAGHFPEYATTYDDYSSLALLVVEGAQRAGTDCVVRFSTVESPLDTVRCLVVASSAPQDFCQVPFEDCRFKIRLRQDHALGVTCPLSSRIQKVSFQRFLGLPLKRRGGPAFGTGAPPQRTVAEQGCRASCEAAPGCSRGATPRWCGARRLRSVNQCWFRHSSRNLPLKLSTKQFSIGLPGRMNRSSMPCR